jgi:hypothetical protein
MSGARTAALSLNLILSFGAALVFTGFTNERVGREEVVTVSPLSEYAGELCLRTPIVAVHCGRPVACVG